MPEQVASLMGFTAAEINHVWGRVIATALVGVVLMDVLVIAVWAADINDVSRSVIAAGDYLDSRGASRLCCINNRHSVNDGSGWSLWCRTCNWRSVRGAASNEHLGERRAAGEGE